MANDGMAVLARSKLDTYLEQFREAYIERYGTRELFLHSGSGTDALSFLPCLIARLHTSDTRLYDDLQQLSYLGMTCDLA